MWWSDAIYELFGLTPGQVEPSFEAFLELLHPDDRPLAIKRAQDTHASTDTVGYDMRLIRPDGQLIWIHSRSRATRDAAGHVVRVEGTDQDITDRKLAEQALRKSEERNRVFADYLLDGVMIHDRQGTILDVNAQSCAMLGYQRDELIGQTPFLFDVDLTDTKVRELGSHMDSGETAVVRTRHRRKDGQLIPVEVRVREFPLPDKTAFISFTRDLTETRRAEQQIQEVENRFLNVLNYSPSVVFIKDLEGRFLFINRAAAEQTNIPQDQWIGKTIAELLGPEAEARNAANDRRVIETLEPLQIEEEVLIGGGRVMTAFTILFPLLDADGRPNAVCGFVTDITERRRTREERDRLWNHSTDLLMIGNERAEIKQLNPAWQRTLGWDDGEVIGQPLVNIVYSLDVPEFDNYLRYVIGSSGSDAQNPSLGLYAITIRLRSRDQSLRWVSWQAIYEPCSKVLYGFARDVTEQKRLEEQYRQSQKMEAIGQLAGGVAHDFNNLLTVIRSYSELLLERTPKTGETADQLIAIREASERAAGLTAQLLAFSRKAIIEPRTLDLNQAVEEAARLLRRLIGEDIHLITSLRSGLWKVTIDPVQLEQTLMNLAVNARDAMPRGGNLSISTANIVLPDPAWPDSNTCQAGPYVQLSISDDGQGMSEEVKRHLFEPFYTTKGVGKGSGLGLATVYGIVHQAGGIIQCESDEGQGTTFRIYLPAAAAVPNETEASQSLSIQDGHETILLVEDEDAVRHLAQLILEMHGYKVLSAHCGEAALEKMHTYSDRIDLLLSDVVMPGLAGRDLADRAQQIRSDFRVLYMSGYTDDTIVRSGVASATDWFLQKPFSPASLTQKVREVLDA